VLINNGYVFRQGEELQIAGERSIIPSID
jgi:hypothetical protein